MVQKDWLIEELKTIRNLANISLVIIDAERKELLPTVLELLYEQSQLILDEQCIVKEDESITN